VGDELRPVIAADERRRRVEAGEFLQYRHHVFGLAAPAHLDRQAETAVLVDHVEELEAAATRGGVVTRPGPLLLAGIRPLQALFPPKPVHPLVAHQPAFPAQLAAGQP